MREEYFAPLGMSSPDFNSLIRRRCLSHLTHQLIEQGRLGLPGLRNTANISASPADADRGDVANTPDPSVTNVGEPAQPPRSTSSIYSCDTDGNSLCSSAPILTPSSGNTSCENLNPASIPLPLHKNSSSASMSSFVQAAATSTMSASIHKTTPDTADVEEKYGATRGLHSLVKEKMRVSSSKAHSLIDLQNATEKAMDTNHVPRRPKLYEQAAMQPRKEPLLDLRAAIAALLKRHEQRKKPQELIPPVDQIFELGRLRRAIRRLDFETADMIILASDLTSLVPIPTLQKPQSMPDMGSNGGARDSQDFFRDRLASKVHRRTTFLKLQIQDGLAREIELWYRDVVDLVGWRDEDEARQPWSWREKSVFF